MKKIAALLFLLPILIQCKAQQKESTMTSYEYADGNGNLYSISNTAILYDPITPKESSTGMYSGGEAYTIQIEQKHFDQMETVFKKVIENKTDISETRSKGTGALIVFPSKKTYIFKKNSPSKKDIDDIISLMTNK